MNKELYLLLICTLFSTIGLFAQDSLRVDSRYETKSAGFGIGLEYGGLGLNLVLNLTENIGITGGAGLTPIGAGYNGGLKLRFHPEIGGSTPYIQALYGYNAMIYIKNRDKLSKFFYGPSIGGRLDFPIGKGNTCLSIGVYYPIWGSEVDEYIEDLKDNKNVEFENELFPFTVSIGLRFR